MGAGDISPVDVLDDCITAIEERNPSVNAVVTTDFDRARDQAKVAEAQIGAGVPLGPLHGLPVLIKDLAETEGLTTTFGSRCFVDYVPTSDAIIVERLKSAGAIVIGKTNTPEFGAGANTANLVFGATGSPVRPDLTSGGSSGGSAAALACDMAPIASGSDLGGSLRIPASFCGVVGMRPSPGLVPSRSHVSGFSPLWTDGPMARNVADMALMLSVISGFDARDPLSSPASSFSFEGLQTTPDLSDLKVGFSTDLGVALVDNDIRAVFEDRKSTLARYFQSTTDLNLDLSAATRVFQVLRAESLFAAFGGLVATKGDLIGDNVRNNVRDAQKYSLTDTAAAGVEHTKIYRAFQRVFDDVDVVICPATAVSPFSKHDAYPTTINGQQLDNYYAWYAITWALSLVGCPIVTIPFGTDHNGMPFGIQIIGKRFDDHELVKMALAVENIINFQ
jgi:Asp-tRNA(Asn)/Glu-tRNA(Gln) amidotransferase A subunit family amidase